MANAKTDKPTTVKSPKRKAATPPAETTAPPPAQVPTKLDLLIGLLRRPTGATLEEMMAATGWLRHSVRGTLAGGVKAKLGAAVTSQKIDGVRRYRAPVDGA